MNVAHRAAPFAPDGWAWDEDRTRPLAPGDVVLTVEPILGADRRPALARLVKLSALASCMAGTSSWVVELLDANGEPLPPAPVLAGTRDGKAIRVPVKPLRYRGVHAIDRVRRA